MKELFFEKKVKNKKSAKKEPGKTLCEQCGLFQTCLSPYMEPTGEGRKKILIIAEAPGKKEDEAGTQLIGDAGKLLRQKLAALDIDLDKDCWKTNAIVCRPPKNRTPTAKEIKCCHPRLIQTIKRLQPEKIFLLGKTPISSFFHESEAYPMESWVGKCIPNHEFNCFVFPLYHPQFLHYNRDDVVLWKQFDSQLKQAVEWEQTFDPSESDFEIELLTEEIDAIFFLNEIKNKKIIAFDYEATGLKPYHLDHKILCMGIAYGKNKAVAFPIFESVLFKNTLKEVLTGPSKKIAHNIKYEELWTRKILGYRVENWYWDTMLASHILDNSKKSSGLKFEAHVNFGFMNYDNEIKSYISAKEPGISSFNRMVEVPLRTLLHYCAMDALFSLKLYAKQRRKFDKHLQKGFDLFMEGSLALVDVEDNGMFINHSYFNKQDKHLQRRMDKELELILSDKDVKAFEELEKKEFNINSNPQLSKFLYSYLKLESPKETKKGNPSTDAEALEHLDVPFVQSLLKYRKLDKIKNTYISSFLNNMGDDGKIHPNFSLTRVKTYRSSSSDPNFQNIPKRDKEAQKIIRTGLLPSPGRQLAEVDYSGIEVRISSCYHQDPAMLEYIYQPDTDMHRDQAIEIFQTRDITKEQRYLAKNGFVFPQFYGSYYELCAQDIWSNMSAEMKKELPQKNLEQFKKHLKKVEDKFWNERFTVYRDWKKKVWEQYLKRGYVETVTGFRPTGRYKKNEVLNYPIQGAAFHCLLKSLISLNRWLKDNKMETNIIGQIHDSIVLDLVPSEKETILPMLRKIMCEDIREDWKWIIVPLDIEIEVSEVDGNWYNLQEV